MDEQFFMPQSNRSFMTLKHNQMNDSQLCVFLPVRRLSWFDGSGMGFSLDYPTIGLHAISRDVSAYPQEHLYVMVNGKLGGERDANSLMNSSNLSVGPQTIQVLTFKKLKPVNI